MRYVALLRAINVGGRVVKMDDLRRLFASMGLRDVRTFIASGNVIFESAARNTARLEAAIEKELQKALGYTVATFLRSAPELISLAEHPLVSGQSLPAGHSLFVIFTRSEPSQEAARKLASLGNDIDRFVVHGRAVLWILRGKFMDSTVTPALLDRAIAQPATVRNATTVRKLAAKAK